MTERQLEAVKHIANGNTVVETAGIMYVSKSSVNQLLAAAKKNEKAKTLAHLVSIAIAKGMLVWTDDNERDVCESEPEPPTKLSDVIDPETGDAVPPWKDL